LFSIFRKNCSAVAEVDKQDHTKDTSVIWPLSCTRHTHTHKQTNKQTRTTKFYVTNYKFRHDALVSSFRLYDEHNV